MKDKVIKHFNKFLTVGLTCAVDSISLKSTVAGAFKAANCVSAVGIYTAIGTFRFTLINVYRTRIKCLKLRNRWTKTVSHCRGVGEGGAGGAVAPPTFESWGARPLLNLPPSFQLAPTALHWHTHEQCTHHKLCICKYG